MNSNKPLKQKKCRHCKEPFAPSNSLQAVCGFKCALAYGKSTTQKKLDAEHRKQEKARRAQHRADKERIKTVSNLAQELQPIFNKYIRLRDKDKGCISCGKMQAKFDAGHYFSVGARPNLRFLEDNCHKQCAQCNSHTMKGGNLVEYRLGLIERFGADWVEDFEQKALSAPPANYTREDLREMKKVYREKIKKIDN